MKIFSANLYTFPHYNFSVVILGIRNRTAIHMPSTLAENGLDSLKVTEIKEILENNYNISLNVAEIANLSFQKLFEIDQNFRKGNKKIFGR